MVSIIKNQILKHLSKFAKNLSLDQIQLSTLRGHCELHHLELDELLLADLLELPPWLVLTRAVCNYVTLKIQWTKLKSVPIHLVLDEVLVEMETSREPRATGNASYSSGGKYGFSDRVVDGMTVVVNSVVMNLRSEAFEASFQLSRVLLESRTPRWERGDLRLCRIKAAEHLLMFKVLEWQVMRLEAKARSPPSCPPLRLITNAASCRMVFKKRLSDCSLVGARLLLVLEALLWALTDAQLVAALHFCQSLADLNRTYKTSVPSSPTRTQLRVDEAAIFRNHDVVETSYHLFCTRLDLHLCDDMDPKESRSGYTPLQGGGALHVVLEKLLLDYYPMHRVGGSRQHWPRYTEPSADRRIWLQQLLSGKDYCGCLLVRLGSFAVHEVCSAGRGRLGPRRCIASEQRQGEALHLEWGHFFGQPRPYIFAHLGPTFIRIDLPTLLWAHAFLQSVRKCMGEWGGSNSDFAVMAVRIEALLPKVCLSGVCGSGSQDPLGAATGGAEIHLRASRVVASNLRLGEAHLGECLEALSAGPLLFETSKFPWRPHDPRPISESLLHHCLGSTWDIWSVHLNPCWAEFVRGKRQYPCLEPLPLTLWYCHMDDCLLLHVHSPMVVQVSHSEYVLALHLAEALTQFMEQLFQDAEAIAAGTRRDSPLGLAAVWPSVELALLLDDHDLGAQEGEEAQDSSSSTSSPPEPVNTVARMPPAVRHGMMPLTVPSAIPQGAGSTSGSDAGGVNHKEEPLEEDSSSLRSEFSSDSDQLLGLAASMDEVELGQEVTEEVVASANWGGTLRRGRAIVLRLHNAQLAGCSSSSSLLLLLQGQAIDVIEEGGDTLRNDSPSGNKSEGQLSIRLDSQGGQKLRVLVQGLSLRLSSSALTGLAQVLRDEGTGHPLPLRLLLHELCLVMQDEGSGAVYVPHCLVDRTKDGDLYVMPVACGSLQESVEQLLCDNMTHSPGRDVASLIRENERLRQQLRELHALQKENQSLRQQVSSWGGGEREVALELKLAEQGEEARRLEEEKGALLATLHLLEEELIQERSRQRPSGCDAFCGSSS
uniref:Putative uhrf1-binding protein 1 n=1 Tax=Ornithodoros turicata TaxID=34597 RepID=A0A2R5LM64_9ACAR